MKKDNIVVENKEEKYVPSFGILGIAHIIMGALICVLIVLEFIWLTWVEVDFEFLTIPIIIGVIFGIAARKLETGFEKSIYQAHKNKNTFIAISLLYLISIPIFYFLGVSDRSITISHWTMTISSDWTTKLIFTITCLLSVFSISSVFLKYLESLKR